ncbi:MAG TPA: PAS domain-containing protein [Bryobacteraceae bacterium]|nr:PAS domain-containing protein [Bryobacteraceae bacterium]
MSHLNFHGPQLWLYLLALVTFLTIALRRVLRRQIPLSDELHVKTVAIEHVHSGVAWVRPDGTIGSINASFAATLNAVPRELVGRDWYEIFSQQDRVRMKEAYSQMLLLGKANLEVHAKRTDGTYAGLEVLLVAQHDHKSRFIGHHCLAADRTRERLLEEQIRELTEDAEQHPGVASAGR